MDAGSVYEKPMQTGTAPIDLLLKFASSSSPPQALYACVVCELFMPIRRECTAGTSHLLEYMAFKTTMNRSHFRLVREVRCQRPYRPKLLLLVVAVDAL